MMGMDVYGITPDADTGQYFRRSCWGWRPLWDYCCAVSDVARTVQYGQSNDGDGLDGSDAARLAETLTDTIQSGAAETYIAARDARLAAMPDESCVICDGTGRRLKHAAGAGLHPCNGCHSTGRRRPSDTWYVLDIDTIRAFAEFCRHCGGFEIR